MLDDALRRSLRGAGCLPNGCQLFQRMCGSRAADAVLLGLSWRELGALFQRVALRVRVGAGFWACRAWWGSCGARQRPSMDRGHAGWFRSGFSCPRGDLRLHMPTHLEKGQRGHGSRQGLSQSLSIFGTLIALVCSRLSHSGC